MPSCTSSSQECKKSNFIEQRQAVQWITTTCYVSAVSNNSPGRVAALVCRQVSVTLAVIASFASRLYIFSLVRDRHDRLFSYSGDQIQLVGLKYSADTQEWICISQITSCLYSDALVLLNVPRWTCVCHTVYSKYVSMTILQCALKASWAGLICRTYQYYRRQWLPIYTVSQKSSHL